MLLPNVHIDPEVVSLLLTLFIRLSFPLLALTDRAVSNSSAEVIDSALSHAHTCCCCRCLICFLGLFGLLACAYLQGSDIVSVTIGSITLLSVRTLPRKRHSSGLRGQMTSLSFSPSKANFWPSMTFHMAFRWPSMSLPWASHTSATLHKACLFI